MPYSLAPGHNNAPGLIPLDEIISGQPMESHPTSLGTFRGAREFVNFDGVVEDDSFDMFDWTFAALLPSEIEAIETDILDGQRSGPVTAETRNRYGTFVQRNAILTLPQQLTLQGQKFGGVVFAFTQGEPLP